MLQERKKTILYLCALMLFFLPQCNKHTEMAPFKDGLYFEYGTNNRTDDIYEIVAIKGGNFKITKTEIIITREKKRDFYVDVHGKVYKSTRDYLKNRYFALLWAPVHEFNKGDTFEKDFIVEGEERWRRWNTVVLRNISSDLKGKWHFEKNTGYLVGFELPSGDYVLMETNADIPEVEEDE